MKLLSDLNVSRWLISAAVCAIPLFAFAAPPMPGGSGGPDGPAGPDGGDPRMGSMHGFMRGPMHGAECGPPRWPGAGPGEHGGLRNPFMHGLKLTEDQEDRIFAIRHAAAPALRDAAKALRKAHEALREFAMTPQYDENHLKALTEAVGKAESQLLLLRIRGEHELYGVLSPEQRAELKARRDRWESRDAGGPRGGPHGGTPPPPHG